MTTPPTGALLRKAFVHPLRRTLDRIGLIEGGARVQSGAALSDNNCRPGRPSGRLTERSSAAGGIPAVPNSTLR